MLCVNTFHDSFCIPILHAPHWKMQGPEISARWDLKIESRLTLLSDVATIPYSACFRDKGCRLGGPLTPF